MVTDVRPVISRLQGPAHAHLQRGVDGAGRLVEDQQVRVREVGTEQRDQLPFPRGQRLAALADLGVQAAGQSGQPVAEAEGGRAGQDLRLGRRRACRSARWR